MNANHCDAEGCGYWQRIDADFPVFYVLEGPDEAQNHFCSLNCVMVWAAAHSSPPSESKEIR